MNNNRTINAKRNIMFGYLSKLVTLILEFIARSIFIQILGEELLGINGVFTNIIQVLSLAELGMNNVVGYSFYKPLAQNNNKKIVLLISFYRKIYNTIAVTVLAIGLGLIPFLKYVINTEIRISNITEIYLIFLLDTVISYLFVYKCTLLRADQKEYIATMYTMVCNVLRTILQIFALICFKSIIIYLGVKVLMSLINNILIAHRTEQEYPYIKSKSSFQQENALSREDKQDITKTIGSGFVYKLSGILLNSTDNLLISIIVGTVWVGYLANYLTIINGLSSFYSIIFSSLTAGIGNLVVVGTEKQKKNVFNIMLFVSTWMAIVFSGCLFSLSDEFIALWIGKKYVLGTPILLARCVILFLSCALQPLYSYREALGLYKKTKYIMLLASLINILLSIMLGFSWGVAGILFASIIAMFVTYIWYEPVVLYRDCFKCSVKEYFLQRVKDCMSALILMIILFYTNKVWKTSSWEGWLIKAFIYFILANIYCICIYGRKSELKCLISKIKRV